MVVAPPHHHTRQWSYTALSRSRAATRLLVLTESARDQPSEHSLPLDPLDAADALTRVAACMTRDETDQERKRGRAAAATPTPMHRIDQGRSRGR